MSWNSKDQLEFETIANAWGEQLLEGHGISKWLHITVD
jgi:hypothetical protein